MVPGAMRAAPAAAGAEPGRGELSGARTEPSAARGAGDGHGAQGERRGSGRVGNPGLSTATVGTFKMERRERVLRFPAHLRPACRLLFLAVIKLCAGDLFSRLFGYLRLLFANLAKIFFLIPFFSASL